MFLPAVQPLELFVGDVLNGGNVVVLWYGLTCCTASRTVSCRCATGWWLGRSVFLPAVQLIELFVVAVFLPAVQPAWLFLVDVLQGSGVVVLCSCTAGGTVRW